MSSSTHTGNRWYRWPVMFSTYHSLYYTVRNIDIILQSKIIRYLIREPVWFIYVLYQTVPDFQLFQDLRSLWTTCTKLIICLQPLDWRLTPILHCVICCNNESQRQLRLLNTKSCVHVKIREKVELATLHTKRTAAPTAQQNTYETLTNTEIQT